jgi:hypothetical protein
VEVEVHNGIPFSDILVKNYVYVARQLLGIDVTPATNTQATTEELLAASFSMRSVSYRRRVCGSVCILQLLGNGLVHTFPRQQGIVGGVVFCAVRVVSKESCGSVCILLQLLGNGSVHILPRQLGIVGGVVFYAVRVVSKESIRLVLPRNSCLYFNSSHPHHVTECVAHSLSGRATFLPQDRKDFNREMKKLSRNTHKNTLMNGMRSSSPSPYVTCRGMVIVPYVRGIYEKFRRIGNRFEN